MFVFLFLLPPTPTPKARAPGAEQLREQLNLPESVRFTLRSTVEARLVSERACGRYEQLQSKP